MANTVDILHLPNDPFEAFQLWMDDAIRAACPEPTAMTLATVTSAGKPTARVVLLKDVSHGGFVFFTNYNSPKAVELGGHPHASLVFLWLSLGRQVRVEGRVEKVSAAESDAYFQTRPRGSQIGAWSSPQSQMIEDRDVLLQKVAETESRFEGGPVTRPPFWGGFRVIPERIEFWEARESRLHERFIFERRDGQWARSRLAP